MPYYHITPTVNVPTIMQQGLVPQTGERSAVMEQEDGVYLFKTRDDAGDALTNWLGDEFGEDEELSMLEVSLPPNIKTLPTTADYEVVVAETIPPKYIKDLGII